MVPFQVRKGSTLLDETLESQSNILSMETHTIDDDEMWLRMHPQLDGTFLYFPTLLLTLDEHERRDEFPAVYLTPDSDGDDTQ